jgi:flagellar FliJ protein
MSATTQWDRLTELATRRRDEQAQYLGEATRERDEARRRLELLLSYRTDYQARLAQAGSRGIDREGLANYRAFLAQLERAIAQQQALVDGAERKVEGARSLWASERRRVESFRTLDQRHLTAVARQDARREQKNADEWTARASVLLSRTPPDTDH